MIDISQITKWYNLTNFCVTSNMFHHKYKDKSFSGVTYENFREGNKKKGADSMFCGSSVGGTCWDWSISYSLVSYFLKLGIWLWTECVCLCIWNINLLLLTCFCSWVFQLITRVLMLVVSLCKPVICKLKSLGAGNLSIINQWGEPQKGGTKFWNFSGEK